MINDLRELGTKDSTVRLICPYCSYPHLHMSRVELFIRERTKDKYGSHYEWDEHDAISIWPRTEMRDSPSLDKNALVIKFWCEGCRTMPKIEIVESDSSCFMQKRESKYTKKQFEDAK